MTTDQIKARNNKILDNVFDITILERKIEEYKIQNRHYSASDENEVLQKFRKDFSNILIDALKNSI